MTDAVKSKGVTSIRGKLTFIGSSEVNSKGEHKCTMLTIGGVDMQAIWFTEQLYNHLSLAMADEKDVVLFFFGKVLYAIQYRDKVYRDDYIFSCEHAKNIVIMLLCSLTPAIFLTVPGILYYSFFYMPRSKETRSKHIEDTCGTQYPVVLIEH